MAGLTNSPLDYLTRPELDASSLALFNFCTLVTGQKPPIFLFSTIHTISFTSSRLLLNAFFDVVFVLVDNLLKNVSKICSCYF